MACRIFGTRYYGKNQNSKTLQKNQAKISTRDYTLLQKVTNRHYHQFLMAPLVMEFVYPEIKFGFDTVRAE